MRQGNNSRRGRGRSGRRPNINPRSQTFDSNGPEGRIRGNPSQVYEKYLALARDAQLSGDRIHAEALFQYAEHYYRLLNDSSDPQRPRPEQRDDEGRDARDDDDDEGREYDDERAPEAPRRVNRNADSSAPPRRNGEATAHEQGRRRETASNDAPARVEAPAEAPVAATSAIATPAAATPAAATSAAATPGPTTAPAPGASEGDEQAGAPRSRRGTGRRRRTVEEPAAAPEEAEAGLLKILGEAPRRSNGAAKTTRATKADKAAAGEAAPAEAKVGVEEAAEKAEAKPRVRRRKRVTADDEKTTPDGSDPETASA
jgi:hypothetical protein